MKIELLESWEIKIPSQNEQNCMEYSVIYLENTRNLPNLLHLGVRASLQNHLIPGNLPGSRTAVIILTGS